MARTTTLAVRMNGEPVGRWSLATGEQRFQYDPAWLTSAHARPISLSMPLVPGDAAYRGERVRAFFDNLLTDSGVIRARLAARHRLPDTDAFTLLGEIGRDCAGALQIAPEDAAWPDVHAIDAKPLDDDEIEAMLLAATTPTFGNADPEHELRISIAGAQEKTALTWHRKRWCLPRGATPTTHIFKLPLGLVGNMQADMSDSIENEWLCARIIAGYGIRTAACEIATFGRRKVLVVERFDRRLSADKRWWIRLPMEDMCQATGRPPTQKYEADGGPGMAEILAVVKGSSERARDLEDFLRVQLLFWLLVAPDGHAKNFSVFIDAGGRYRLTPIYDVLSALPLLGKGAGQFDIHKLKLAMAVRGKNAHYHFNTIQRRHWNETARRNGVGADAEGIIASVVASTPGVIDHVSRSLPRGFPARVSDAILEGLRANVARLAAAG